VTRAPTAPNVDDAVRRARDLAAGLDPRLRYHDARHTFTEVLPAACALAAELGVPPAEAALIEVAAAFHDLGFLRRRAGHEAAGAELARRVLGEHGFDAGDVARVEGMILATRLPQRPRTRSERIVADADMALLAAPDFLRRNEDLRLELVAAGIGPPRAAWLAQQRRFLLSHRFHTDAAARRFAPGRWRNAVLLGARLRRLAGA
jgi:uncharacterized protein